MATVQSKQRAKYFYIKRKLIEPLIESGKIDANDIIYTTDTYENIFIGSDLSVNTIKSKIYRFPDTTTAEKELNNSSDTYEGQLIAIAQDGVYTAYIVNKNINGSFYVTRLSEDAKTLNYDNLGNRPIENVYGTLDKPVTVSDLDNGIYSIKGQYKICTNDETTYLTTNDEFFLVKKDDDIVYIRKITATDIIDFQVVSDSIKSKNTYPTTEWIEKQGYATETYVNNKIAALDFMTKADVTEYVEKLINEKIDNIIDSKIDEKIADTFSDVDESDITYMF